VQELTLFVNDKLFRTISRAVINRQTSNTLPVGDRLKVWEWKLYCLHKAFLATIPDRTHDYITKRSIGYVK